MTWWFHLTEVVWRLLDDHTLSVVFVLLLLEEAGLPPLIPGDLLMAFVGVQAAAGKLSLIQGLLVLELATIIGGSILYWIASVGGHAVLNRVGRYVGTTPERLKTAEEALERHGGRAIVLGRLVPSLCIMTAIAAGILGMPFRRYLPALALGGFLHLIVVVLVGYAFGPPVLRVAATLHLPFGLLVWGILFVGLTIWLRRLVRKSPNDDVPTITTADRLRCGLLAGLLAAVESMLAANLLLDLSRALVHDAPSHRLFAVDLDGATPLRIVMIAMTLLALLFPFLWGALYSLLESHLSGPAALRGALFAVAPLVWSLLVLLPATGAGMLGVSLDAGPIPVIIEVGRFAIYGVTLGLTFPALATATARRSVPA
ncbi:MAG: DedA family protein [Chloroflexi bacterium]|nr:DedA family protein [Chloroflexota bacterium]